MVKWIVALLLSLFFLTPAEARHRHHHHHHRHHHSIHRIHKMQKPEPHRYFHEAIEVASHILPHPEGCPATAFCACGQAVDIFGAPIRRLWLAAEWFQFAKTQPSEGMVAVRQHHIFRLIRHIKGDYWLTIDHNSGHHLSREHVRSIAGYTIVDPHRKK